MTFDVVCHTEEISVAEWLKRRQEGIGGSDAGVVMGTSRWKSPYTLFAEKSGLVILDQERTKATEYGKWLELPIAQKFAKDNNVAVVQWPVMVRSAEQPFMLANIDYLLVESSEDFPPGVVTTYRGETLPPFTLAIVEVKTTGVVGAGFAREWEFDGVPANYNYQGMHYASVLGLPAVVFVAFIGKVGLVTRERRYATEDIERLIHHEHVFWEGVKSEEPPAIDGSASSFETLHALYPEATIGTVVEADDFTAETFEAWLDAKHELEKAQDAVDGLRASLELAIGAGEALSYNGELLLTYRNNKDSEKFNTKAFRVAHPDLFEAFSETVGGARVLRVKGSHD